MSGLRYQTDTVQFSSVKELVLRRESRQLSGQLPHDLAGLERDIPVFIKKLMIVSNSNM